MTSFPNPDSGPSPPLSFFVISGQTLPPPLSFSKCHFSWSPPPKWQNFLGAYSANCIFTYDIQWKSPAQAIFLNKLSNPRGFSLQKRSQIVKIFWSPTGDQNDKSLCHFSLDPPPSPVIFCHLAPDPPPSPRKWRHLWKLPYWKDRSLVIIVGLACLLWPPTPSSG